MSGRILCLVALVVSALSMSLGAYALTDQPKNVSIPPGELRPALLQLSAAFGVEILYDPVQVKSYHTDGVSGAYTATEAASALIKNTPLVMRQDKSGALVIVPSNANESGQASPASDRQSHDAKEAGKTSSQNFQLDRMDQAGVGATVTPPADEQHAPGVLEEVVITGTKLAQPVRSVAGSISALSGPQLEDMGARSFADYLGTIPGVVFNAATPGISTATIRGVSTTSALDQGQGTTGYYINEVPLTDPNYAVAIPDIDTFDVDNVAVMRGPQGTLFGSSSLGGAINYQAASPDLHAVHTHLQGTMESVGHGGSSGTGDVMLNVPVATDQLAVRGVFVYRSDPGFISNVGTGQKDSNRTLVRGGRGQVLWKPNDRTAIKYLYLRQSENTSDNGYTQPDTAGAYAKQTVVPEPQDFETTIHSLRLDQSVGVGTLTVTATYHLKSQHSINDVTSAFGSFFNNEVSPLLFAGDARSSGTTYEARLSSAANGRVTYVIGAMRDLTRESFLDTFGGVGARQFVETNYDPIFGAGFAAAAVPNDNFYTSTLAVKGEERAFFGEATYHVNNKWSVTLGGRAFDTAVDALVNSSGLFEYFSTDPSVLSFAYSARERARGFTPKASVTWSPDADVMVYALASKGFRFGGPNLNPPDPQDPFPPTFRPDSLWNYELGTRTNWLDRRMEADLTAFYIDWTDIQVRLGTASGLAYATNFGKAANIGLEGAFVFHPVKNLALQASATYLNATLRQAVNFGYTSAAAGATLPGASRWSVSGAASYQFTSVPTQPTLQVSDRYLSSAPSDFGMDYPVLQNGYNILGVRMTSRIRSLNATLFVDNVADRRGVTIASVYGGGPLQQFIVRPRSAGLTLDYRY